MPVTKSNCNYPDSLFLPKKTRTFTFSYWPSGYCARHNLQTGICGLQNTPFHLPLFPASNYRDAHPGTTACASHDRHSQQPTLTLYLIPVPEMRISPLSLAQSDTIVLRFSVRWDAQDVIKGMRKGAVKTYARKGQQFAHGASDDLQKAERWEQEGPIRAQKTGAFGKLSKKSRPTFLHL